MAQSTEGFSVAMLQNHHTKAWEHLYDLLSCDLRSFVQRIGATSPDDIVSETMLNIVRDINSFHGTWEELRPWAFRIARHRVIDAARLHKRRPEQVPLADTSLESFSVHSDGNNVDLSGLAHAFEQLSQEQREVLWLRYVLDFSLATTSEIMGSTPDAVASMAHRALGRLRQIL
jgi:RNA polymerase sigma-70 factor (ECF subfamily)